MTEASGAGMRKILVWDWPSRVGHWLMALCFVIAYASGDSEEWRLVHVMAGGALAGLAVFRLVWGLLGTRHARFVSFLGSPGAAWRYLLSLVSGKSVHYTGHNPAGAWAIVALLGLGLSAAASGWPVYQDLGGDWLEEFHELAANGMLLVVLIHLLGVVVGSLVHRENLVRAMLTGWKTGTAEEAIGSTQWWVVPVVLACAGYAGWYLSR